MCGETPLLLNKPSVKLFSEFWFFMEPVSYYCLVMSSKAINFFMQEVDEEFIDREQRLCFLAGMDF
jgi:hypothetical protein